MTMSYEFNVVQFALAEQLMEGKKYVAVFTELNVYFVKFLFLKMPVIDIISFYPLPLMQTKIFLKK